MSHMTDTLCKARGEGRKILVPFLTGQYTNT